MLVAIIVIGVGQAAAVAQSPPATRPEHARAITCTFKQLAKGTWIGGVPRVEAMSADLVLRFQEINVDEGSARVTGPFGTLDIIARLSTGILHFLQVFVNGPLATTTIWPVTSTPGRFIAVYSRHEYTAVTLPGFTSRPEQYYGDCAIE